MLQRFYVLGNPQGQQQGQQQQQPLLQQFHGDSILKGFDAEMLAAAFKMNREMASKLKGENVKQGHIITIEKELQVTRPEKQQQQQQEEEEESQQGQERGNGLEETSCSQNIRINIDKIDQADIFNPQAGHLTSLNSHHLPILNDVRLSAERGHLKRVEINLNNLFAFS